MFAYCLNNPACRIDTCGTDSMEAVDLDGNSLWDEEDIQRGGGGGGAPTSAQTGNDSLPSAPSPQFTPDQQAVIEIAKMSKAGLSMSEAEMLVGWAKEYGISCHEPTMHEGRSGIWSQTLHINIMKIHIPIY